MTEFLLIVLSFASGLRSGLGGTWKPAAVCLILAVTLYSLFIHRIRRAHFAWDADTLALLGLPLFSYLLLRSKLSHHRGKVSWKGRKYSDQGCLLATGH